MKNLWLLTTKNLKLLVRSKSSALIVFFAPLLIILILGLSFNTSSKYGLNIGVYAETFTEDVNSLISSLQEQEYKIIKYETSLEECVEDIKLGFVHTCVSLPDSLQVEENKAKEITFYVDPSKINLVWAIQEDLGNKFNLRSQEVSKELAQNILTKLIETKNGITEKSSAITSVKEKSNAASSSTAALKAELINIDLNVPKNSYNLAPITSFKENLTYEIKDSLSELRKALESVGNANISSGKSAIENALNQADIKLNKVLDLVAKNGSGTLAEVSLLATSLSQDLEDTKAKLISASELITSATSNLDSTTQTIKNSVVAMEEIQTGLEQIKTNLEQQKVTEAEVISVPLITKIEEINPNDSYLNYMFPALLVLVVMFSSLLLGTTLVMMEKNSPAFFRNYFVPIKKSTFVLSIYLTNLIISLVQISIILGVSLFFLKKSFFALLPISLILLISSSVFIFLGMFIGYLFKSEETGVLASISLGSLFLFLSGVILPLESVSSTLREIVKLNPFVISENIIRKLFLFSVSFKSIGIDLLFLVGYALILFVIILVLDFLLHQHLLYNFTKKRHLEHRQKDKRKNV